MKREVLCLPTLAQVPRNWNGRTLGKHGGAKEKRQEGVEQGILRLDDKRVHHLPFAGLLVKFASLPEGSRYSVLSCTFSTRMACASSRGWKLCT